MPDTGGNIPTKEMNFSTKDEVIEWILRNQLGRRNLTDVQRNEVALRYEEVIDKQMKEKQSQNGKNQSSNLQNVGSRSNEPLPISKTTKRKELAKIAGTSEGSVQRTKFILENGTAEQIKNQIIFDPGGDLIRPTLKLPDVSRCLHFSESLYTRSTSPYFRL